MLLDTDLLIWYMRGDENARDLVEGLPNITLSAVTYMELVQGMRNKVELATLDAALVRWKARQKAINKGISEHAVLLVRRYFRSTLATNGGCPDSGHGA
uniref:PIN domain-containing protein n=1 Tax=Candidatus Kentrum sp. TC TaxID=2126339 RepID=A0A450ZA33_9GAMM|nr:MAG: hypothetical protein BECKTC1821D_GA0114238_11155 [Candidatus Kentron sp. TC]